MSFNDKLNLYKFPIILSLVGLVLLLSGIFSSGALNKSSTTKAYPKQSLINFNQTPGPSAGGSLVVDLSGAVAMPGLYTLPANSRIGDLIKMAGGFSPDADKTYLSKYLNMSQKVSDSQKIYIPFTGETTFGPTSQNSFTSPSVSRGGPLGLNSASQSDLESLPGIGPATAQKIISGRPYASVDDLINNKVVSKSVFTKIKDLVNVN